MRLRPKWWRPYITHAAKVAVVASVIISALYVCVVATFDGFADTDKSSTWTPDSKNDSIRRPTSPPGRATPSRLTTHTTPTMHPCSFGRPRWAGGDRPDRRRAGAGDLGRAAQWPSVGGAPRCRDVSVTGSTDYRRGVCAGQSLAEADHVGSDLLTLEVLAGPLLFIAVFFGTFLIGVKAASPVELARRRQLEFTADASHEIRTPLSVIEAEVSLARTGQRDVKDYQDTLRRIAHESTRLRAIVDDLLWLARFDSEPPPPSDQPVDVSAIAAACADRFDSVARGRGITLSVSSEGEGQMWINAPPEWIDRLTAVLVDNACRYAGSNGMVRLQVTTAGNRVSLAVDDSGPGIAPEARAALFDRFHRATDEGNGAGLGLAIGDAVVRATGGEWRIGDSDLGGAHMEVRWHRSHGAKGATEPKANATMAIRSDSGHADAPIAR